MSKRARSLKSNGAREQASPKSLSTKEPERVRENKKEKNERENKRENWGRAGKRERERDKERE